ncbi:MAG: elongation factor Ts [Sphingomonadales bacterium]|nr:elongation factor Ts [Sphingomonadales bacterium]
MNISASDVNKLRQQTGAGMMDCKKALTEANGDFEEAVVILRKKGQKVSASRADREANEGVVVAMSDATGSFCILVEVRCETDFVAKNDDFSQLARRVAQLAIDNKFTSLDQLQSAVIDGISVAEKMVEYTGKIGEKISVSRFETIQSAGVVSYIHSNGKLGVMVALNQSLNETIESAARDAAMQIAAMNPVAVDKGDVDPSVVEREIEIGKEQARQEGKPEAILEKIAMGKLNKFYQDNTLLNQTFVKDGSMTVGQMLDKASKGLLVTRFVRLAIGG